MKILLFILFIGSIVVACSNDHQKSEVSTTLPEKYDLEKDTSVYSGEMKRYWLRLLLKKDPIATRIASAQKKFKLHTWQISIALLKKEN
jgi:hypothetical protein